MFSILFKISLCSPPKVKSSLHASLLIYRCHSGLAKEDLSTCCKLLQAQQIKHVGSWAESAATLSQSKQFTHLFTCGMLDDFGHALLGLHKLDVKNHICGVNGKGGQIGTLDPIIPSFPSLTSVQLEFSCA